MANHDTSYYAFPLPVASALSLCCNSSSSPPSSLSSIPTSVSALIGNAFYALDTLFFSTPAKVRAKNSFKTIKLTIRIHLTLPTATTPAVLHITDLGAGMTRADLINVLGVGSPNATAAAQTSDFTTDCLGGFFGAICGLASEVEVATKSKFDDYYLFNISSAIKATEELQAMQVRRAER